MSLSKNSSTSQTQPVLTQPALTKPMKIAHWLTLISYLGLCLLIPLWNLFYYPSAKHAYAMTILWMMPLIFPARGLFNKNPYTHAWSGFIAVIYICHALTSFLTSREQIIAIMLELIFASLFLFAGMYFAKWRGEQLGLQLPKSQ